MSFDYNIEKYNGPTEYYLTAVSTFLRMVLLYRDVLFHIGE